MQLVWEPHLEDHWQREMLLGVNWGEPWLPGASWGHYNWKVTPGPTLSCWFVGPTISLIGDPREGSGMPLTAMLNMTADISIVLTMCRALFYTYEHILFSRRTYEAGTITIITLILQMKELWLREVK